MKKTLITLLFFLSAKSIIAQELSELKITLRTLTQLSYKAQKENKISDVILYQQAFEKIKSNYPSLTNDDKFVEIDNYFSEVKNKNSENDDSYCYTLQGVTSNINAAPPPIVVVNNPRGTRHYGIPTDLLKKVERGRINNEDIEFLNLLKSNTLLELNLNQVNLLKTYEQKLNNFTYKNKETKEFLNIYGDRANQLKDLQILSKNKKYFSDLQRIIILDKKGTLEKNNMTNQELRLFKNLKGKYNKLLKIQSQKSNSQ